MTLTPPAFHHDEVKKTYFPAINFDQFCTLPLTKKTVVTFFKLDDKHANYLRFPDATMGGE